MLIFFSRFFLSAYQLGMLLRLFPPIICLKTFIILSGLPQSAPTSHKLANFHLSILSHDAFFNRLLVTSLLNKIIAILIAPNFIYAHGKLVVSMGHDSLKVKLLINFLINIATALLVAYLVFLQGLFFFENLVEFSWLHLTHTYQCHMNSLIVWISCKLVLAISIMQVGNIIVAYSGCFVVLTAK